jgi:hypothetical protein
MKCLRIESGGCNIIFCRVHGVEINVIINVIINVLINQFSLKKCFSEQIFQCMFT